MTPSREEARVRRAYREWQSGPLDLGAEPEAHQLIEAAFKGGWRARDKLVLRLIADADEAEARAEARELLKSALREHSGGAAGLIREIDAGHEGPILKAALSAIETALSRQDRPLDRLTDMLVEETLAASDDEIMADAQDEDKLRGEVDSAIARHRQDRPEGARELRDRERRIVRDLRRPEMGTLGQDAANLIRKLHDELNAALASRSALDGWVPDDLRKLSEAEFAALRKVRESGTSTKALNAWVDAHGRFAKAATDLVRQALTLSPSALSGEGVDNG